MQIVSDDTSALSSVLKADVWRGRPLAEEVHLNARFAELDATPPGRSDIWTTEAENGPARAAALLAGELLICFVKLCQGI